MAKVTEHYQQDGIDFMRRSALVFDVLMVLFLLALITAAWLAS